MERAKMKRRQSIKKALIPLTITFAVVLGGYGIIHSFTSGLHPITRPIATTKPVQSFSASAASNQGTSSAGQTAQVHSTLYKHSLNSSVSAQSSASTAKFVRTGKLGPGVFYENKVVIVTYHDITPNVYTKFVITPNQFSAQLDAFTANHFHVITNAQFINFLNGRGSVPPNAVLLTFDDGYQNMYTYALPVLLAHHMQGTFFVIVGSADHNDPEKLSWPEIKTMEQDGMAFGSHTYDSHYEVTVHGRLDPVFNTPIVVNGHMETPSQYHTRVLTDFTKARVELSQALGHPVPEFAWPYGYGTWLSTAIAHEAGYRYLFTTANGAVGPGYNPSFIYRIDVGKSFVTPAEAVQAVIDTGKAIPWFYPHAAFHIGKPSGQGAHNPSHLPPNGSGSHQGTGQTNTARTGTGGTSAAGTTGSGTTASGNQTGNSTANGTTNTAPSNQVNNAANSATNSLSNNTGGTTGTSNSVSHRA
jgi:peptidoglycan/xylan/chitin deacetylase (PgdA/CDA1 family)